MISNEEYCVPKKILSISATALTIILLIFTIVNEYKYVTYSKELRPIIKNAIPVSCIPLEENNGKIIHINCPLQDQEIFYAPPEFSSNIYSFRGVFFEIKVEMYQWVRGYGYLGLLARGRFEDHVVRTPYNFFFFYKSRKNPEYMPAVGNVGRKYANYAKAGGYRLPTNALINFQKKKKLDLVDDGWFTESEIKPPFTLDHLNTNVYDNYLYTGDPLNPQVGDVRVSFYGSASTHATVIGVQRSRLLNTIFEIEGVDIMKKKVVLLSEDNKIMINQTKDFIHRNYGNIKALWLIRLITYAMVSFQIFSLLDCSRNALWKLSTSLLMSGMVLSVFPCIFWFFCDTVVFLFLFVFLFFLSVCLFFIYNNDMYGGYTEMKNYMKKAATEPTNYTFLDVANACSDIYEDYDDVEKDKINTVFESSSDGSFYNSVDKHNLSKFDSSPAGMYH
ncbi:conserved Plasmodium protein, unknown function [Plasmodium vivax]|uniref:(malaria parasite P. vivax) hypothetical protein n=1 Tax=Plasmodium vivax TaxID=5855 RepID=A0A1G4HH02_PLAVI|nr:unnamed protein product [Plasmodium vivax]CAI7722165.1 transmembrane protein 43, putative [Plasmodium vivax]SCO68732.1 conserved Plasmodium protein, unknown function [Plasmodium vivax]SCO74195.1 conserved Plasmodium protein, unknown function [Plasmodium vivax]VUZ97628.1 transmembrane protein 43, putative [Plasmodium vivax]